MNTPLATFERGTCKAEVYESAMPGQFSIQYYNAAGTLLLEEPLTGVSSYKQREDEILARIEELCQGGNPDSAALSDSGEY